MGFSKEQSVLLSACQTLVSPRPSSIRMILRNCSVYPVANLFKLNLLKQMCVTCTIDRQASLSVVELLVFFSPP